MDVLSVTPCMDGGRVLGVGIRLSPTKVDVLRCIRSVDRVCWQIEKDVDRILLFSVGG